MKTYPALIPFGDFVANVAAAYSTCNRSQRLAVAAADLAAQQTAYDCTDSDADGTVLRHGLRRRNRLTVGGRRRIRRGRGSLRHCRRPRMRYITMMDDDLVLYRGCCLGRLNWNLMC